MIDMGLPKTSMTSMSKLQQSSSKQLGFFQSNSVTLSKSSNANYKKSIQSLYPYLNAFDHDCRVWRKRESPTSKLDKLQSMQRRQQEKVKKVQKVLSNINDLRSLQQDSGRLLQHRIIMRGFQSSTDQHWRDLNNSVDPKADYSDIGLKQQKTTSKNHTRSLNHQNRRSLDSYRKTSTYFMENHRTAKLEGSNFTSQNGMLRTRPNFSSVEISDQVMSGSRQVI